MTFQITLKFTDPQFLIVIIIVIASIVNNYKNK